MFAEDSRLSPLESRKQLLVAESELNRAQSLQEWESMTSGVRTLAGRARAWSSLVSSAASLVAGLLTFRRGPSMLAAGKPSWIDTVLKGVRLAASLGLAFRAPADQEESK